MAFGVAVAAASSGCGASGVGSTVVRAAVRTADAPGYRFTVSLRGMIGGQGFAVYGSGWLDRAGGRAELYADSGQRHLHEVLVPPVLYVQGQSLAGGLLPAQTAWLKIDAARVASIGGGLTAALDPAGVLSLLRSSRPGARLGRGWLGGVVTTRYRVWTTGRSVHPMTVWIDRAGRVRRVRLRLSGCAAAGGLSEELTIEYRDFGPQPPVTAPAAGEVTDVTASVAAEAAAASAQLGRCL